MSKAFSTIEPFASFIRDGIKHIETRSYPTKYRGEIYIHASKRKIPKEWKQDENLMKHLTGSPMYGMVIAKAKLVDCVEMTDEWIENLKESNPLEYELGFYSKGRFGYILEDIEPITPFHAKGKIYIGWELNTEGN